MTRNSYIEKLGRNFVECEQGTPEWHRERAGVITASNFRLARSVLQRGANAGKPTEAAEKLAFRLAVERISGLPLDEADQFQTHYMKRGHRLEPEARAAHADRIGREVKQVGFVKTDNCEYGASVDGLIGDDGGAEYKCYVNPLHLDRIIISGDVTDEMEQAQGGMLLTGRSWWHVGLYCPALAGVNRELTVIAVERDDEFIEELELDLIRFNSIILEKMERIISLDGFEIPEHHTAGNNRTTTGATTGAKKIDLSFFGA